MIKKKKLKEENIKWKKETKKEEKEKIEEKKIKEEEKEKSKIKILLENEKHLEKIIENSDEEINEAEFEDFFEEPGLLKISPSLRKINAPQRNLVRLEENLMQSAGFDKNDKEDENQFKYNSGETSNKNEAKYIHYENEFTSNIMQILEMKKFERKNPWEKTEIAFQNSPQAKLGEQNTFEKYNPAKKFNQDELKKENPLERKEIKYKPLS